MRSTTTEGTEDVELETAETGVEKVPLHIILVETTTTGPFCHVITGEENQLTLTMGRRRTTSLHQRFIYMKDTRLWYPPILG
ncbi:hypothetical protein A2U01_0053786 [Trifolium medium]|uniref:Uncharacterized protein n=1 Tax=Trifolium medium TaxID=97028 RepID=A0A392R8Y5_9FABA|nr:hypothetical protein [Trifolium medium]